jgi:hypothetical protein
VEVEDVLVEGLQTAFRDDALVVHFEGVKQGAEVDGDGLALVLHLEGGVEGVVDDDGLGGLNPLGLEELEVGVEALGESEEEGGEEEGVGEQPQYLKG